jgi:hypothetical protein
VQIKERKIDLYFYCLSDLVETDAIPFDHKWKTPQANLRRFPYQALNQIDI